MSHARCLRRGRIGHVWVNSLGVGRWTCGTSRLVCVEHQGDGAAGEVPEADGRDAELGMEVELRCAAATGAFALSPADGSGRERVLDLVGCVVGDRWGSDVQLWTFAGAGDLGGHVSVIGRTTASTSRRWVAAPTRPTPASGCHQLEAAGHLAVLPGGRLLSRSRPPFHVSPSRLRQTCSWSSVARRSNSSSGHSSSTRRIASRSVTSSATIRASRS